MSLIIGQVHPPMKSPCSGESVRIEEVCRRVIAKLINPNC